MRIFTIIASMLLVVGFCLSTSAQTVVYSENFDDGNAGARWSFQDDGGTNEVDFGFDYVGAGIDEAPNGGGLGVKMRVNTDEADAGTSALVAFPNDQSFEGKLVFTFDLYLSYTPDGSGTTEHAVFGVGHTTTDVVIPVGGSGGYDGEAGAGPTNDGIDFTITPDGGANRDIRVYVDNEELLGEDGGLTVFDSHSAEDEGYTEAYEGEVPGNQWLNVTVEVTESTTVYKINDNVWAEPTAVPAAGNIMIGYMDFWGSVADEVSFAIYDNLQVTQEQATGISTDVFEGVKAFPNPVKDVLKVNNIPVNSEVILTTLNGQQLYKQVATERTLDVNMSSYASGVYLLRVVGDKGAKVQKVVKK